MDKNEDISKDNLHQPKNYKQIHEDNDSGKRELLDYQGTKIPCDIFGLPLKKYVNDISGAADYNLRLRKNLIKKIEYDIKNLYTPITAKFEGSSKFPRPISIPFVNQDKDTNMLFKEIKLEKRMTEKKNKFILLLKKPSEDQKSIPSFICQQLHEENSQNKKYLINLIDNYVNNKKEQHKYEKNFENKDKEIVALNKYKKILNDNMGNKLYKGIIIRECEQNHIKEKYTAIRKLIYNTTFKNKMMNEKFLKLFNDYKNIRTLKNNLKHTERLNRNKSCNNLFRKNSFNLFNENKDKDFTMNANLNNNSMIKTFSKLSGYNKDKENENEIKFKSLNSTKNTFYTTNKFFGSNKTTKTFAFNNVINDIKNQKATNKFFLYRPRDITNYSDKKNKSAINFFKKNDDINNDSINKEIIDNNKYNDDNISFISDIKMKESNLINFRKKITNLKTIKNLQDISNKEKDLLTGFKTPIKVERINIKCSNPHLKEKEFENYMKDIELYEIVNKIQVEKERKYDLIKDNLLRKKLEGKKIFEKNFRRVKFK